MDVLQQVSTAGNDLVARLALPDAGDGTLHAILAAEGAVVLGVLRDFDLLHDLTERRTVTRAVLATDTNFLSALALEFNAQTDTRGVSMIRSCLVVTPSSPAATVASASSNAAQ